jgi:hypothetical protein
MTRDVAVITSNQSQKRKCDRRFYWLLVNVLAVRRNGRRVKIGRAHV